MANLTAKEKALKIIAKQVKELGNNALTLDVLESNEQLSKVRNLLFGIIAINGYELEFKSYKLIKKK